MWIDNFQMGEAMMFNVGHGRPDSFLINGSRFAGDKEWAGAPSLN
jgi:hypothetical protein